MITVYGFSKVTSFAHGRTRDLRVLWALEEMGLCYQIHGMDHPAGDLDTEMYRALNPFQQIPAIEDDGFVLSESAAILIYLGRKSGKLMPQDAAGQAQVMRWCFAAVSTVELPMIFLDVLRGALGNKTNDPSTLQRREELMQLAHLRLAALEQWLQGREFVADDIFTVADILMAHVLREIDDEAMYAPYPMVRAYRERCEERPARKKVLEAYCRRVEAA